MLTKTNYTAWALKMQVFMQAHGVWEAIEPKDPKAAIEDKVDKRALAIIYQGIGEDLLLSIADKKSSKDAWEAIKTVHLGADKVKKARAQTLKAEFESIRMKETDLLDDFCMRLNSLVTNIRALGETVEEAYVVKKLLRVVPAKFLHIASAIEQFGNLETMSVEEIVGSLKAHEERLKGQDDNIGGQLLLTEEEWSKREGSEKKLLLTREEWIKKTTRGGDSGGYENRSKDNRGFRGDRSRVRCFNCQNQGHYARECRKPKREQRAEANLTQINDDEPALLVAELKPYTNVRDAKMMLHNTGIVKATTIIGKEIESKIEENIWYLDNGASNHMTGHREKFTKLDESVAGQVKFGDGSVVHIRGKGSIQLLCKNGEERELKDVFFIPSLRSNIISLGQLSEEGNKVILDGDQLWVYDTSGKLLMRVRRSSNRLYKLSIQENRGTCLLTKAEETSRLWHLRLGHVNYQAMQEMSKHHMVNGMPVLSQPKALCDGCLLSKQTRKPFPTRSNFSAKTPLALIHGDLCGPISPPTPAGNKYFMLLVDDFTRMMWVYMLKSKEDALMNLKCFKALVEKDGKPGIQVFRTDRGGEFCSHDFTKFCEEAGILRHFTAPYSPQQNGVVERRNRTVVAMGRSMLKEMKVPSVMWGEAIRHAVYVLNKLPTRSLTGITPYEAWFGKKPSVDYLRIFGCVAHMKIPSVHVKKLDDSSKKVVHLGREPGTKAYRLYDPITGMIHVSRDVIFDESQGWSWETTDLGDHHYAAGSFELAGFELNIQNEEDNVQNEEEIEDSNASTPQSQRPLSDSSNSSPFTPETVNRPDELDSSSADASSEPKRFRSLSDVYNSTEAIELADEMLLLGIDDPVTYEQAARDNVWKEAMHNEIEAIERNKTWVLTSLPRGHKAIDLKWVFKVKKDTNGEIVKHKARLVAKGYVQKYGIDYEEVFAPVTRMETVRLLLALAAKNDWEVHHLDVKSAFLNGELEEEVYVSQPKGYVKAGQETKVYRLLKALYGLRQAPRAWYAQLNKCLLRLGFVKCPYEHAVYTRREGSETLILGVYVDDLLITGTNIANIVSFKKQMAREFDMTDLGTLSYYLGLEVEQRKGSIKLKQTAYAKKVLEKTGMSECNPVKYPMEHKIQLTKDEGGEPVDPTQFKSMVGGLRYLVHTRPDIAYAVGIVSRYMERPTTLHFNAAKRILRYVKGTINFGLVYTKGRGNYLLAGFSDSDLAGSVEDRRSTGGMVFYLDESLITWISQKQRCVALSSCEAEFMAATAAACQAIWLQRVLKQISDVKVGPVTLYIDNRSAVDLAKNPVFHGRSKHIDVRYHFIRECVEQGLIVIKHISTGEQRADILTKALSAVKFEKMRKLLGVVETTGG